MKMGRVVRSQACPRRCGAACCTRSLSLFLSLSLCSVPLVDESWFGLVSWSADLRVSDPDSSTWKRGTRGSTKVLWRPLVWPPGFHGSLHDAAVGRRSTSVWQQPMLGDDALCMGSSKIQANWASLPLYSAICETRRDASWREDK